MPTSDVLFSIVEKLNGGRPWGRFLDSGTGAHSLRWIQSLATESWCAITADTGMQRTIQADSTIRPRPGDSLVVGNWMDDQFCHTLGEQVRYIHSGL